MGQSVIMGSSDQLGTFRAAVSGLCLCSCQGHEVWCPLHRSQFSYLGHWHTMVLFDHLGLWSMCCLDFNLESHMNSFSVHIKLSCFIEHYKTLRVYGLTDLAVSNCNKFVASGSGDFCIGIVSDWHSSLQHLVA